MKINTTTVAIMLLAIPASAWSASTTNSLKERDYIDTVLDDPLFSQSHMNLSFKNYWKCSAAIFFALIINGFRTRNCRLYA